jgi:SAM-dependent methyltransferase
MATCLLCGGRVRPTGYVCNDRPTLAVGRCGGCTLVQVMDFTHVQTAHYAADDYFPTDLDPILERESRWNWKRIERLRELLPSPGTRKVLDYGCGPGGFLRRAQDHFELVVGYDLSRRICETHRAAGFPCVDDLDKVPRDVDTVAMFHVLEHIGRPWETLEMLRERLPLVDRFVIEVPNTNEALLSLFGNTAYRRNHYSADHVYYFTNQTLRNVVERGGLRVLVDTQLQRYTLGNTFGWLANQQGGGQSQWPWFDQARLDDAYDAVLTEAGVADSVFLICEPDGGKES